jgi:hypothetical protein
MQARRGAVFMDLPLHQILSWISDLPGVLRSRYSALYIYYIRLYLSEIKTLIISVETLATGIP